MKTRLKVCTPEGVVIVATTESLNGQVSFEIPYLEVVKKDKPSFAKDGIIRFTVPQRRYQKSKKMITKYLEDLFLKELSDAKTVHSSNGGKRDPRRVKKQPTRRNNGKVTGKDSDPICDRGGREEHAESEGGRAQGSNMAEGSDPEDGGISKEGR